MPPEFWTIYWASVAFIFGAIVGSFLNVCIWRLPRGESLVHPPSHCPACDHQLHFWPDMVPLLSQVWSRGRCRYCQQRFSWRYFWVELLTAALFLAVQLRYTLFSSAALSESDKGLSAVCGMIFVSALVAIFFIDLEHFHIPDCTVYVALAAAVAKDGLLIWRGVRPLWQQIPGTEFSVPIPLSIVGAAMAFWLLWQFAALASAALGREAMGAGDSMLLAAMGAFLVPWPLVAVAFFAAVALGSVGGIAGLLLAGRARPPEPAVDLSVDTGTSGAVSESQEECEAPPPATPTASKTFEEDCRDNAENPLPMANAIVGAAPFGRGAVDVGEGGAPGDGDEPDVPRLPPSSRWGRIWAVAATWVAVGSVYFGLVLAERNLAAGILVGAGGALASGGALWFGIRQWIRGDREWLPQMDELFEEGEPGPRFIPFGPYLVAGTMLAMLAGQFVVEWYSTHVAGIALPQFPWD